MCQKRFLARCLGLCFFLIPQRANTLNGIRPLFDSLLFQALITRIMHCGGHLCRSWYCLLASLLGMKESTERVPPLPPKSKMLFLVCNHITQKASCCITTIRTIYRKMLFGLPPVGSCVVLQAILLFALLVLASSRTARCFLDGWLQCILEKQDAFPGVQPHHPKSILLYILHRVLIPQDAFCTAGPRLFSKSKRLFGGPYGFARQDAFFIFIEERLAARVL